MTASYAAGRIRIEIHGRSNEDRVTLYENIETRPPKKKWRRICGASAFIVAVVIIIAAATRQRQSDQSQPFSKHFVSKCLEYRKENDTSYCQRVFNVFERAYIGKQEPKVSMEDYDDLIAMAPFDHPCNQTMLWSQTKELVHNYATKDKGRKDYFTMEDTLLGYILDNETWCGKEGSNETFIDGCQGFNSNVNSAVSSFWNRASAAFAEYACGEVTVLLNGSLKIPFDPNRTFARFEIKRLKYPKVTKLGVILVSRNKLNYAADNVKFDLRNALDSKMNYSCNEVTESWVRECFAAETFSNRFISKCLEYKKENNESYCQRVFNVFERAYIGKPESKVSMEDYDDLIAMAPFDHPCNQTMIWSKTKELVHKYTDKDEGRKDYFTMEDTLLGYILDNETWCGEEGSNKTFIDGCQGFNSNVNSAVSSFWNRASAAFAEYACGEVTVILDGSLEIPFDPNMFELKRLKHPKVTNLTVILVSGDKLNCAADNLKCLQKALNSNIGYSCNEVPESWVTDCFADHFVSKCLEYRKENDTSYCQRLLKVFEQAYVRKSMCSVSMKDYNNVIAMAPFNHPCNQTMFWSKTKELVHSYTDKEKGRKDCFDLEDTLLGYILDDMGTWCGKEDCNKTYTSAFCQDNHCGNTPYSSFWNRVSVAFAEYACGEVTVILNGSLESPFYSNSTFARFEINQLKHPKVTNLTVILVSEDKSNCAADNLKIDLRKALDSKISYSCKEVPESRVRECSSYSSDTDVGCTACLL